MGNRGVHWFVCGIVLVAGCCAPSPPRCTLLPPEPPSPLPDLPFIKPELVEPNLGNIKSDDKLNVEYDRFKYRALTEAECQSFAGRASAAANALDEESRLQYEVDSCRLESNALRRKVRHYMALEIRNQSAATALDRFFHLAELEARTAIARDASPILKELADKSTLAKNAKIRFPVDPQEIDRQRNLLKSQLVQADAGLQVLNIDLHRRLGLPPMSSRERLWPVNLAPIVSKLANEESCVKAAIADRPELLAWRELRAGLNMNTLSVARERLGVTSPGIVSGQSTHPMLQGLTRILKRHQQTDSCAEAELELRRQQISDVISTREREIADETRVAVVMLNSQFQRVVLARNRVAMWSDQLQESTKQRQAGIPFAELQVAQHRLEWLKARSELMTEIMAWHQARIRLRAAMGWLIESEPHQTPLR